MSKNNACSRCNFPVDPKKDDICPKCNNPLEISDSFEDFDDEVVIEEFESKLDKVESKDKSKTEIIKDNDAVDPTAKENKTCFDNNFTGSTTKETVLVSNDYNFALTSEEKTLKADYNQDNGSLVKETVMETVKETVQDQFEPFANQTVIDPFSPVVKETVKASDDDLLATLDLRKVTLAVTRPQDDGKLSLTYKEDSQRTDDRFKTDYDTKNQKLAYIKNTIRRSVSSSNKEDDVPVNWNIGDIILDLYHVTGLLGEGGMGKVYKVRHLGWNIELAVKSPKPEALKIAGGAVNFAKEAETWVNLGLHPNTVSCYYVRSLGSIPRIFAEYIKKGSLSDAIKSGSIKDLYTIIDIAIQSAWGLAYSHERGLIHQDMKPANVMLSETGSAKVTDFGLAKGLGEYIHNKNSSTQTLATVKASGMTPAYCSPEQASKKPISNRTDLWSWGVSLLEMFTGGVTWLSGVVAPAALEDYIDRSSKNSSDLIRIPSEIVDLLRAVFEENPNKRPEGMLYVAEYLKEAYFNIFDKPYPRPFPKGGRDTADSLNNRSISIIDLGHIEEGINLLNKAVLNESHHPESTLNYGLIRWRSCDINDAELISSLEEALKSHGMNSSVAYYLALAHMERDDCEKAISALKFLDQNSQLKADADALMRLAKSRVSNSKKLESLIELHKGSISSISIDRNGKLLLTGSDDHTAKLLDLDKDKILHQFSNDDSPITAVSLSANGKVAAIAEYNKIDIYDTVSFKSLNSFKVQQDWIKYLKVSEDGKLIGSASWDKSLKIISVDDSSVRSISDTVSGTVTIDSGFKYALFQDNEGKLNLVDIATCDLKRTFNMIAKSVAISYDQSLIAIADLNGDIHIYRSDNEEFYEMLKGNRSHISTMEISPCNNFIISGSHDKTIKYWNLNTKRVDRTFYGHTDTPKSIAIANEKSIYCYTGGWDGVIAKWCIVGNPEFNTPMMVSRVQASEFILSAVEEYESGLTQMRQALKEGDSLSAIRHLRHARNQHGFYKGEEAIKAWSDLYSIFPKKTLSVGWEKISLMGHKEAVTSLDISFSGKIAVSGSKDYTAIIWDIENLKEIAKLERANANINDVSISHNLDIISTATADGMIRIHNKSGRLLKSIKAHNGSANSLVTSKDSRFIISAGADGFVNIISPDHPEPVRNLRGHNNEVNSVFLDPMEQMILSCSKDRTARIWDLPSGESLRILSPGLGHINTGLILMNQREALLGTSDGKIIHYDIVLNKIIKTMEAGTGSILSISLSFDQNFLISADSENSIRLWDVRNGANLRIFEGHSAIVNDVVISAEGKFILSASDDKTVKVWILDWDLNEQVKRQWDNKIEEFLRYHIESNTGYIRDFPKDRKPFSKEVTLSLSKKENPEFTEDTKRDLEYLMGLAGFGYIENRLIFAKFTEMLQNWSKHSMPPIKRDTGFDDIEEEELELDPATDEAYYTEFESNNTKEQQTANLTRKNFITQWFSRKGP